MFNEFFSVKKLTVADSEFLIESADQTDHLFESLLSKGDDHPDVIDERIPYWAELWPSAIGLSQWLFKSEYDWNQKKVLEIGCGPGLCGIVARHLGADVVLSDYDPNALLLASRNWKYNTDDELKTIRYDWRDALEEHYDVIIGSDILYEKRAHAPIFALLNAVCPNGTEVILSDPGRSATRSFYEQFHENKGITIEKYREITNDKAIDILRFKTS